MPNDFNTWFKEMFIDEAKAALDSRDNANIDYSGEPLITVAELPTENINEDAFYTITKTVLADIIQVTEDYVQPFAALFDAGELQGGLYVIPTKTNDGIVVTTNDTFGLYYIEDEDDIFVYTDPGTGTPMWIAATLALNEVNNGKISDISEATELGCYYILDEVTTFHRFNKADKGLTDVIMDRVSLATYGALIGFTHSFNNVPTKPSEGILESNPYGNVFHFYYMEDENDVYLYMGGEWYPGSVVANMFAGGELIFVTDAVQGMHEDNNVYAVMSDGWSTYVAPSGGKPITENGAYDVTDKEYVTVDIEAEIPDGYVYPSGTLDITENGTHDVKYYTNVRVSAAMNYLVSNEGTLPAIAPNGAIAFVLGG